MKKKLLIAFMALSMVTIAVNQNTMTTFAADDGGLFGIINDMFGQDKPELTDEDMSYNNGGAIYLAEGEEPDWGPLSRGESINTNSEGTKDDDNNELEVSDNAYQNSEDRDADSVVNEISEQSKPTNSANQETSYNNESANSGAEEYVYRESDRSTETNVPVRQNSTQATAQKQNTAKHKTTTKVEKITDAAILAELPSAMAVSVAGKGTYIHSLNKESLFYTVWYDGEAADLFWICDENGMVATLSGAEVVLNGTNTYVDVTTANPVKGATVQASALQKAAWVRLFGINGVKVNGVLTDTFVDDPAVWN